jgi:aminoglycoside phosphotransferase (APT) family kinase protein
MTQKRAAVSQARRKLHAGEGAIDEALVVPLLAIQFPQLADRPLRAVPSTGTVNAIYGLGDHRGVRLPRVDAGAEDLDQEGTWLPKLAPCLSLHVPEVVAIGHPMSGYPFPWAIYRCMDGNP